MNLWLKSWVVDSDSDSGKYAGAIIGLILIAILNEFLVMIRVKLHQAYYPCGTKVRRLRAPYLASAARDMQPFARCAPAMVTTPFLCLIPPPRSVSAVLVQRGWS